MREAVAMLDIREATGHNDGPEVSYILSAVDMPEGLSWCGAFVYTAYLHAGVELPPPARAYAWAPTWTARNVIWRSNDNRRTRAGDEQGQTARASVLGSARTDTPAPGDVFGLWFKSKRRVAHVGIVRDWTDGNYAITIEGNTNTAGSREGDGVYSKRRLKSQIYAVSRWTTTC